MIEEKKATIAAFNEDLQQHTSDGEAGSQKADTSDVQVSENDEEIEYPTGPKLWLITLALSLAVLCMALDNSIIATAIPKITDQFNSLDDIGWYGSAYLLTTACFQLFFGKLYTFFSIKYVFMAAMAIFEIGSAICGATPNSTGLIIGRAIAGIGASGFMSGALIIVAHSVPLPKRPAYTGIIGSMFGIASVCGPLLGGAFTDSSATWRWCFYINLPVGAVTVIILLFFFQDPHQHTVKNLSWRERMKELDIEGSVILIPGIICFLLALQWGGAAYPWNNWRIILLWVLFGILSLSFAAVQYLKKDRATIPLRIIKQRTIWSSALFSFCLSGGGFFILSYYLPIWFQAVKGASAVGSGIMNLGLLISFVVLAVLAGILVSTFGYYSPFILLGAVIASIGAGLITTFKPDTDRGYWIGYQIITGTGIGMAMQQPLMAVQTVLNIRDLPTGTVVLVFTQTLGGAIFVAIAQSVFQNQLIANLAAYAPSLDPLIVISTGATSIQKTIPSELLPGVTLSYNNALSSTFTVALSMLCVSILPALFIEWKSVHGNKKSKMKAAGV